MINKDELIYKITAVIEYLETHGGNKYKVYDKLCPGMGEADSNITEYAKDVLIMIEEILKKDEIDSF